MQSYVISRGQGSRCKERVSRDDHCKTVDLNLIFSGICFHSVNFSSGGSVCYRLASEGPSTKCETCS